MLITWTRGKDHLTVKLVQEHEEVKIGPGDQFVIVPDHFHPGTYLQAFNRIRAVKVEHRTDAKINEEVVNIVERIFFEESEKVKGKKTIEFLRKETMTSGDFYVVQRGSASSGNIIVWTPERRNRYWRLRRTQGGCLLFFELNEVKIQPIPYNFEKGQFE